MKNWFDIPLNTSNLHRKFKHLLDPQYSKERTVLEKWIDAFNSPDGDKKAKDEFQKTFHSVFLEIYLNQLLIETGASIDSSRNAPDFRVTNGNVIYSIEATVANIAEDDRQEHSRTEDDIYGHNDYYEIIDSSITRLLRRIKIKSSDFVNKYDDETKSLPFVIAVGDYSSVNYGQAAYFAPIALLYEAYYDPGDKTDFNILCMDSGGREYKHKRKHQRKKGMEFDIGMFCSEKYKHISAVMYTSTLSLGKLSSLCKDHGLVKKYICLEREGFIVYRESGSAPDETIGDGLFVFHNPFASHPLKDDFLNVDGVTHFRFETGECEIKLSQDPSRILIRRYIGPAILAHEQVPDFDKLKFIPVRPGSSIR